MATVEQTVGELQPLVAGRCRRPRATMIAIALAAAAFLVQAPVAGAALPVVSNYTPQIGWIPFSGDVVVLNSMGALVPVDPTSTPASAQLFNILGNSLNTTWGQFSSAAPKSAAWTLSLNGTTYTQFLIGLSGLVPNGVYSLFYRTFNPNSNNAYCPNIEPSLALPAAFPQLQKPDSSSFVATSSGKGLFFASLPQNLLAAQQLQVSVIYHFNGQAYGPVANEAESLGPVASEGGLCRSSYGVDAMRQMLIIYK
jgi:hypothetical protein